mgnify:CR=1 FL=1
MFPSNRPGRCDAPMAFRRERALGFISGNWRDVRTFGPGVLGRHLGRLSKERVGTARLRDIGPIKVRPHQSDMACLRQVFADREYDLTRFHEAEARITARYESILSEGSIPIIIDGGANIGAAALWFARKYPAAAIMAVEPDESSFALLRENVGSSVTPVKAALGAEAGYVTVHVHAQAWATQTVRADSGLPVVTVDDLVARVPNGKLFIAKIDIEGFEKDLFASNVDWIAEAFVIYIEPHDWMLPGKGSSRPFMEAIVPHGFEVYVTGENLAFVRPSSPPANS